MDESARLEGLLAENARLLQEKESALEELENFRSIVACERVEANFELNKELEGLRSLISMKDNDIRNLKLEQNQKIASLRRDLTAANRRSALQNSAYSRSGGLLARAGEGARRSTPKPPIDLTELNDKPAQQRHRDISTENNEQENVKKQLQKEDDVKPQTQSAAECTANSSPTYNSEIQPPRPQIKVTNEEEVNLTKKLFATTPSNWSLFTAILVSIQRIALHLGDIPLKELKVQPSADKICLNSTSEDAWNIKKKSGSERYQHICNNMLEWYNKAMQNLLTGMALSLDPMVDMTFEMVKEARRASAQQLQGITNACTPRESYHLDVFTDALRLLGLLVDMRNPHSTQVERDDSFGFLQVYSDGTGDTRGGQNEDSKGRGRKRSRVDKEQFSDFLRISRNELFSEDFDRPSLSRRDLRSNFAIAANMSSSGKAGSNRGMCTDTFGLDLQRSQANQSLHFSGLSVPLLAASSPRNATDAKIVLSLTKIQSSLEEMTCLLGELDVGTASVHRASARGCPPRLAAQRTLCRLFWALQAEGVGSRAADSRTLQAFLGSSLVPILAKSLLWPDIYLLSGLGEGLAVRREVVEVLMATFAGNAASMSAFLDSHSSREAYSEAIITPLMAQFRISGSLSDADKDKALLISGQLEGLIVRFQAQVATLLRVLFAAAESQFIAALTVPQIRRDLGEAWHHSSRLSLSSPRGPGGPSTDEDSHIDEDAQPHKIDFATLSTLSLTWSRALRNLDRAPTLLANSGAWCGYCVLVGQLSKLLNAFAVKVQSSTDNGEIMEFGRELAERVHTTLVRWDTRHHHQALLSYGDDVLELRELLEFYCQKEYI